MRSLDPAHLWGDETKLRQVIDNLLSNAIKYAPRGSMLYFDVRGDARKAVLRVADQGPGVEVVDRERLFEAFYRGSPPPGGAGSGSGIGLAIVKEYVEAHRGTVRLVEGGEGEGAVFKVELPADMRGMDA
jgi:two-component system, NtrC family, sensor histidine kinase GlrK